MRYHNASDNYDLMVTRNLGLGQLFHDKVLQNPDATAIIDGRLNLTYQDLHARCLQVACELQVHHPLTRQEPVGIIARHGIWNVVAQLSIIYAGGTCTTIDSTLPVHQIRSRLHSLHVRYILVDSENSCHSTLRSSFHQIIINELPSPSATISSSLPTPDKAGNIVSAKYPLVTGLEHRSHIIHTSGTTSEPKAVEIASRSILEVVYHAPFEPLCPSDVVAHVNNATFDVALFDIWAPLLRGASIAVLPKNVLLDLSVMAKRIEELGITVMATTTALLNLAAATFPGAFSKLRMCWIGGEAANIKALKQIFIHGPPRMLINAYGPTECCVLCLAQEVTVENVFAGRVSIGKPVGQTVARIVNPTTGEPVMEGESGELWIAGPGVSPGYLNQAEKTSKAFVYVELTGTEGTTSKTRMYRTGDLVQRRPDNGEIEYLGRLDNQVKIRGHRVELEAVEIALLTTEQFSDVAALKVEVSQDGAGSVLVAYVIPASSEYTSVQQAAQMVRALLPAYMVPQIELIDKMPLNLHGKVDRKQLALQYCQRWQERISTENRLQPIVSAECNSVNKELLTTSSRLESLWSLILGAPAAGRYAGSDDFFLHGGTSLQASLLISQIRSTFKCELSLLALYDNSTLSALSEIVESAQGKVLGAVRDERDVWVADAHLADSLISPSPTQPVDWRRDTEGRVFFTGATGFVGTFMLADLLSMREVHQVGCLVRASTSSEAMQRLETSMKKYDLWRSSFKDKLLPLPGQLEEPHLGLGAEKFEWVANWASVIFHLGARVNYTQPYSKHRPANTLGTLHVMNLAVTGRLKTVHYVSSISCFGPTGYFNHTSMVLEDECLTKHLDALPYDHGYAQSQWVVEQLLYRLIDRGLPIAIYRPGFITGHSQTGMCNPDDFFSRLIVACEKMGCYPRLPNQRKEFVPVDYVNAVILRIASMSSATASPLLGHAYHIVPPGQDLSVDMDDTMELVSKHSERGPLISISYSEWVAKLAEASPLSLQPLQPMLAEIVHDGRTRWELYENMPVYDQTNTLRALEKFRIHFPVLDSTLMQRYMRHLTMMA